MEYNYREEMIKDIKEQMKEDGIINKLMSGEIDKEEAFEMMHDDYWIKDNITGNGSGSHFFNTYKAEEAICHNWDLIEEAQNEFGPIEFSRGPEYIDVCIRCYLLGECISTVLDEIEQ